MNVLFSRFYAPRAQSEVFHKKKESSLKCFQIKLHFLNHLHLQKMNSKPKLLIHTFETFCVLVAPKSHRIVAPQMIQIVRTNPFVVPYLWLRTLGFRYPCHRIAVQCARLIVKAPGLKMFRVRSGHQGTYSVYLLQHHRNNRVWIQTVKDNVLSPSNQSL